MKRFISYAFCVVLSVSMVAVKVDAQKSGVVFATEEQISADLEKVPCKDKERLEAVKDLFRSAGAADTDLTVEKHDDVENLIVTKKGATTEKIVVGAHYDKTVDGCGAIDNWSGIVVLANIYRTIKDLKTQKTYIFAAFGEEEKGLVGSEAMAKEIPKEERVNYCAMVNFDSFGMAYPQALRNVSTDSLISLAEGVSNEMKIPFGKAAVELARSDSASFRSRKIPAITLHGLGSKWQDYLHTSSDKMKNLNKQSVYIGYRHGLVVLAKIDAQACSAFRK